MVRKELLWRVNGSKKRAEDTVYQAACQDGQPWHGECRNDYMPHVCQCSFHHSRFVTPAMVRGGQGRPKEIRFLPGMSVVTRALHPKPRTCTQPGLLPNN